MIQLAGFRSKLWITSRPLSKDLVQKHMLPQTPTVDNPRLFQLLLKPAVNIEQEILPLTIDT